MAETVERTLEQLKEERREKIKKNARGLENQFKQLAEGIPPSTGFMYEIIDDAAQNAWNNMCSIEIHDDDLSMSFKNPPGAYDTLRMKLEIENISDKQRHAYHLLLWMNICRPSATEKSSLELAVMEEGLQYSIKVIPKTLPTRTTDSKTFCGEGCHVAWVDLDNLVNNKTARFSKGYDIMGALTLEREAKYDDVNKHSSSKFGLALKKEPVSLMRRLFKRKPKNTVLYHLTCAPRKLGNKEFVRILTKPEEYDVHKTLFYSQHPITDFRSKWEGDKITTWTVGIPDYKLVLAQMLTKIKPVSGSARVTSKQV